MRAADPSSPGRRRRRARCAPGRRPGSTGTRHRRSAPAARSNRATQLVVAALQAAVGDDRRLGEDAAGADADRQRHGGGDQLLGAGQVSGEVRPVGAVVDHLDLVVAEAAIAEQFGESVELGPPGPQVAPVEVGDRHGVAAAEGHRQAAEPAAELHNSTPMRIRWSRWRGWLTMWRVLSRTAPSTSGSSRSRAIASARGGQPQRLVDAEEQPVRGQVDEQPGPVRARLVTEHGEGGLRDDSPLGHRIDESDGAELRDRRGRPHQRPVVTGVGGPAGPRRAASASPPGHPDGAARRRCGSSGRAPRPGRPDRGTESHRGRVGSG